MRNILWIAVFSCLFIKNGYTQVLVVDTAFVAKADTLKFSNATFGAVEIYSTILDSLALAEALVKAHIDSNFYIKPIGDHYVNRIGDIEGEFKIIHRRQGYLELYNHGKTYVTLFFIPIPIEGRAVVKYWYEQESDSMVQNRVEVYFKSDNVLLWIAELIVDVLEDTAEKLLEYIGIIGEEIYRNKLIR